MTVSSARTQFVHGAASDLLHKLARVPDTKTKKAGSGYPTRLKFLAVLRSALFTLRFHKLSDKIKNTRGENRVLLKGENMKKTL